MKAVCTRLGDKVDHSAAGAAVLGSKVAGEHAEFLHGIERDSLANAGRKGVNVFGAVEQDARRGRTHSVDCETGAAHLTTPGVLCHVARGPYQGIRVAVG